MSDEIEVEEGSWQEQAGLSDNENFAKFETVNDLAQSYQNMQSLVSRSVRLPTEDASEEVWEQFHEKLAEIDGVIRTPEGYAPAPEDPNGYQFEEPENMGMPPEMVGDLKAAAHSAGLSPAQAAAMHDWMNKSVGAEHEAVQEKNQAGENELKALWGAATEQRKERAKMAITRLMDDNPELEDMVDRLAQIGHDATGIKLFDKIADMLGEAGITPATPRSMLTPSEASNQLRELVEANRDKQPGDRGYESYVKKRNDLYKAGGKLYDRGMETGY